MELPNTAGCTLSKPPMFITIGPQCSGKTTFLRGLSSTGLSVVDVTLDDQHNVYIPVDTRFFLYKSLEDPTMSRDDRSMLQKQIQGKAVGYRIFQEGGNDELRLVLQRLQGLIDRNAFATGVLQIFERQTAKNNNGNNDNKRRNSNNEDDTLVYQQVAQEFIQVVEQVATQKVELPDATQLFIVESLFRPSETQSKTGIELATLQLETTSRQNSTVAVAWGNTNAQPRDYRCALEVAASTDRPVIFIANCEICGIVPECKNGLPMALKNASFSTLLQRNMQRLLETGKYVPSKTMWDFMQRTNRLLVTAAEQATRQKMSQEPSNDVPNDGHEEPKQLLHLELDQQLARLVNFEMKPDRTVQPMPYQPPTKQERPQRNEGGGYSNRDSFASQKAQFPDRARTYPNGKETTSNWDNGRGNVRGYNPPGQWQARGRAIANGGRDYYQSRNPGQRVTPSNWNGTGRGNYSSQSRGPGDSGGRYQSQQQRPDQRLNTEGNQYGDRQNRNAPWRPSGQAVRTNHAGSQSHNHQQRPNPWIGAQSNQEHGRNDKTAPRQYPSQTKRSDDGDNN